MKKILRDPLVHFLALGLGLFVLFVLALVSAFLVLRPAFVRLLRSANDNDVHWSSLTQPASYLIGAVASMWMIERVAGFWA
jgi:hypothetical protein